MARLLLGVSGGIAAYKALEFTRLAMKAGHRVRVVQTEASTRFVGTASFAGITGAPVLLTEWEPDPMRGAFPGDPLPEHAPLSHLALVEHADAFLIAPASANTVAKLAARPRRQPAHRRGARVPRAADRRAGDERGDVRARRHPEEPLPPARARGDRARAGHGLARLDRRARHRAPARAARAAGRGRGRHRRAGLRSHGGPARARHRRRHARADRRGPLRRQPLLRAHGLRARRGGRPPRRAGHDRRRQRVAARARRRHGGSPW